MRKGIKFGRLRNPRPGYDSSQKKTLHDLLALHERILIIQTIQLNRGSRNLSASALGVSRTYLWRRMRALKIDSSVLPRTTPGRPRKKVKVE